MRKRKENKFIDPFERDVDGLFVASTEERRRMQREAFFSDIFLTGTNAMTLDGKLVNTDGTGGRVAAMIFGPKKVIVVAGVNKIVKDLNEAMARVHNIAAPMNGKRHVRQHMPQFGELPCIRTHLC